MRRSKIWPWSLFCHICHSVSLKQQYFSFGSTFRETWAHWLQRRTDCKTDKVSYYIVLVRHMRLFLTKTGKRRGPCLNEWIILSFRPDGHKFWQLKETSRSAASDRDLGKTSLQLHDCMIVSFTCFWAEHVVIRRCSMLGVTSCGVVMWGLCCAHSEGQGDLWISV